MNEDIETQSVEESDKARRTLILTMLGIVIVSTCALLMLAYTWLQSGQSSLLADYFASSTPTRRPSSTPQPTHTLAPNLTATQRAWVRPAQSPLLGSTQETKSAVEAGVNYLESYALVVPDMPDISQNGDVYLYEIMLAESEPLIWSYGWCTTTPTVLEENFAHIQLEFILNESPIPVSSLTITDTSPSDSSSCREYAALVNEWTEGQHQLETRVTFAQEIDDGWNVYPAGTHIFKYFVTVKP